MRGRIIEYQQIQALGIVGAELIQKHLKAGAIETRQFQPVVSACTRRYSGIEPIVLIAWSADF